MYNPKFIIVAVVQNRRDLVLLIIPNFANFAG